MSTVDSTKTVSRSLTTSQQMQNSLIVIVRSGKTNSERKRDISMCFNWRKLDLLVIYWIPCVCSLDSGYVNETYFLCIRSHRRSYFILIVSLDSLWNCENFFVWQTKWPTDRKFNQEKKLTILDNTLSLSRSSTIRISRIWFTPNRTAQKNSIHRNHSCFLFIFSLFGVDRIVLFPVSIV